MAETRIVNAGIKSKKEAAQRLIDGEVFLHRGSGRKIWYNPNGDGCPFRFDESHLAILWDFYEEWDIEEEIPWYENIPEQGVLCYVSYFNPEEKNEVAIVYGHNEEAYYPFETSDGGATFATPLSVTEASQYIYSNV